MDIDTTPLQTPYSYTFKILRIHYHFHRNTRGADWSNIILGPQIPRGCSALTACNHP